MLYSCTHVATVGVKGLTETDTSRRHIQVVYHNNSAEFVYLDNGPSLCPNCIA